MTVTFADCVGHEDNFGLNLYSLRLTVLPIMPKRHAGDAILHIISNDVGLQRRKNYRKIKVGEISCFHHLSAGLTLDCFFLNALYLDPFNQEPLFLPLSIYML